MMIKFVKLGLLQKLSSELHQFVSHSIDNRGSIYISMDTATWIAETVKQNFKGSKKTSHKEIFIRKIQIVVLEM